MLYQAGAIAKVVRDRRKGIVAADSEESSIKPVNAFESGVQPIFSGAALIVTRSIEWGQVILGFEQAQKYTIFDEARYRSPCGCMHPAGETLRRRCS